MNKVISALLLVLIATVISACFMLPSLSAEKTERQANEIVLTAQLKDRQANEVIFQQSIRIVTLEGRLTKAMKAAQDTVYAMDRREKLLEETALKLQTAMVDLSKSEAKLDKNASELKMMKEALSLAEKELKNNKLSEKLLRNKVRNLSIEIKTLKKKLNLSSPDPK